MVIGVGFSILFAYRGRPFTRLAERTLYLCTLIATYFGLVPPVIGQVPLEWELEVCWLGVRWYAFQASELVVTALVPVFLLMRLRQPRPPARALIRQPGTVVALAAALGYVMVPGWLHHPYLGQANSVTAAAIAAGGTVAVAWSALALSRRWESEPSWLDRMGCLLGLATMVVGVFALWSFRI